MSIFFFLARLDNAGIVAVTNKGRSRNLATNIVLKSIFALQARNGVRICTEYVPSLENIADPLSRGNIAAFLANFPEATQQASFPLPSHLTTKLISLSRPPTPS